MSDRSIRQFKFERPSNYPEDLVLDEIPSLQEIIDEPEAWLELVHAETFPGVRDVYIGPDKEKILLFHGGAAFDDFDARYWGQGEGSATSAVIASGGRISTATNILQALYYCMFVLERGCPAALHLVVVDRGSIVDQVGTEVVIDYDTAANFTHHESVEITPSDILRIYESDPYAEDRAGRGSGGHRMAKDDARRLMRKRMAQAQGGFEREVYTIMELVFPFEDYEREDIPNDEDVSMYWHAGVRDLIEDSHRGTLSIESSSAILRRAICGIMESLEKGARQARRDGDVDLAEQAEYLIPHWNMDEFAKERYFKSMVNVFEILARSAANDQEALVYSVMRIFADSMRRNQYLINVGADHDPWAHSEMCPENPLDIKILVPSAIASQFNRNWRRKSNLTTLGHALSHPDEYFLFPDAVAQKFRCTYWNTSGMDREAISYSVKSQAQRLFKTLSTF